MKKIALILFVSLILSSCATVKSKLSDAEVKSISKVGLISILPKESNIHYVGFTMFNNAYNTFRLETVLPNEVAYNAAYKELKNKNLEVVKLESEKDLVGKVYKSSYSSPKKDVVKNDLIKLSDSAGVNHIVIIYSRPVQDRIAGSAEFNSGFGIFKRVTTLPHIYSTLAVDIVQTRPFAELSSSGYVSFNTLDKELWHNYYEDDHDKQVDIPENEKKLISESLEHAITDSVRNALLYSGLTL